MKSFITILCIGFSVLSYGQNKISGKITNTLNESLLGVTIYIEDLQKGTSTDKEGYYEFTNLPGNVIKIIVAFIGYETQIKLIQLQQTETVLDFTLEETVFKMDEIIISTPFN